MKNIANKNIRRNNQNESVKRINRVTKTFRSLSRGNQAQMLDILAAEINQTNDLSIKSWLVRFDQTLRAMGGK